jgi:hypothetical protein
MTWLYCAAIFLGSCLLFLVQPQCAKMLLPLLGGTPAVWNTCMVFFQTGLLLGYAYAHWLPRWLGVTRHAVLHVLLLIAAYFTLPIGLPDEVGEGWHPVLWLLASLALGVGPCFVLLAAGAPLLQRWFVCKHHDDPRDPYFLYAASNLGSFLALGLFPFVLEPSFTITQQNEIWRFGFLAAIALTACCVPLHAPRAVVRAALAEAPPAWRQRGRWIVLALIPSSLLLSVTTHLTTDIAAIPLLWLIPLGLYLLSFTLVFAQRQMIPHRVLLRWLPLVAIVLSFVILSEATEPLAVVICIHLLGFFWLAMACHGTLARTRPSAVHLTDFYLCLAVGGMLGGILNGLVAPLLFSGLAEYPLMIVAACFFAMNDAYRPTRADFLWAAAIGLAAAGLVVILQSGLFGTLVESGAPSVAAMFAVPFLLCYIAQDRPARFALSLGAVFFASTLYHGVHGASAYRDRSYFGIHRVTEKDGMHRLVHGNTVHGQQSLDPRLRGEPSTYYSKAGPIGDIFRAYRGDPRLQKVGIVGLGAGTIASYSQAGDDWTYFEIDPSVRRIAEDPKLFTYLLDARGTIHVELGDARLRLKKSPVKFGLLIVDAFGSDAIPVHLLTREAVQIYVDHLEPSGLLAFHISNRYVDLEPVLANLGASAQPPLVGYIRQHGALAKDDIAKGAMASDWILFARKTEDLEPVLRAVPGLWRLAKTRAEIKIWTDDYSNLFQVFRWRLGVD